MPDLKHARLRRLAEDGFVSVADASDAQCEGVGAHYEWDARLLPSVCPLVARKFGSDAADAVLRVLTQVCRSRPMIWNPYQDPYQLTTSLSLSVLPSLGSDGGSYGL